MEADSLEDVAPEVVAWKTLSITHVEYPVGDKLGKILAIYSLAPIAIAIILFTWFMSRRDLHTFTLGLGVICNHGINHFLKQFFKEPRPVLRETVFEEYGMPSNHSQYMWFVCFYLVLFVKYRLRLLNTKGEIIWKLIAGVLSLASAGIMAYSRVYLGYHTVPQVVWGSVVGAVFALVWFLITQILFTPLYARIANWRISEFFMIRDCTGIPNIMWFEYVHTRGEAYTRKKKERKNQ